MLPTQGVMPQPQQPTIGGLDSGQPVGVDAAPSPVAPKLTAARLQDADYAGEQRLKDERDTRLDHINYYVGRWYGKITNDRLMRPFNRMAHMIHAFEVQVVPSQFRAKLLATRAGLDGEAKQLEYLIDNNLREQDALETIFEPCVIDALVSPWGSIYTGRKPGRRVLEIDAEDVDPGEPFSQFIEFDDVNVDPSAKDIRRALWFRHKFRVPRDWLLESPAFANCRDLIMALPSFEDGEGDQSSTNKVEAISTNRNDRRDAVLETVELLNFAIFDHGRIWEATLAPKNRGPAQFLRFEPYTGADGGPYDLLSFHKVPGNFPSLSPASNIRDVAEAYDIVGRKAVNQAENSKKALGYQSGAEEDAEAIATAADGASVKMNDPSKVQVYDLNMVQRDMVGMLEVINKGYQDLAGNPDLLAGSSDPSNTLGQDEIQNARAGARVSRMSEKVVRLISNVIRKWAYEYQKDPIADYPTTIDVPGLGPTMIPYQAAARRGEPADFKYTVRLIGLPNANPDMQARRVVEFLQVIGQMMPMFMPGPMGTPPLFNLRGVIEELAPKYGIENPEQIINDQSLALERLQAEIGADAWLRRANLGAPDLAGPGTQSGIEDRAGAVMQQGAPGIPGMGMMFPGGPPGMGGGMAPPAPPGPRPIRPVKNQQGLRQASR